jgi:hypothetical protein
VSHRAFPVVALIGIYVTAVVVYGFIGRRYQFPNLFPDEMKYGKLSQSLAAGDGLQWRGDSHGLPPLWPAILSLVWNFGSTPEAYGTAKVLGAALCSLAVVPTWLLARTLVGPRRALIAAALSIAGAWMAITVFIASENVVYPLATASLASLVVALRRTSVKWLGISLAFALLAASARTQMLSLFVVVVVALGLDVLRRPRNQWRGRIDAWPRPLSIGLVTAVTALVLAFIVKPDLTNYEVLAHHASVKSIAATTGRHAVTAIVAFAVVPIVALFALMARRANWRSETTGPLLVTIVAAAIVMIPVIARFEVWATQGAAVERYTMYIAPLLCVALVLAPGRVDRRGATIAGLVVLAALFAAPQAYNGVEQPGLFGLEQRLADATSFFTHHIHLAVVLAAIPVVVAGVWGLSTRRHPRAGFAVALIPMFALMVVQAWTYHDFQIGIENAVRSEVSPAQFDWVDARAKGPVAMLAVGKGEPFHQNPDLYTDFFNKKIKTLYSTEPVSAYECELDFKPHGFFSVDGGSCPAAWPRYLVMVERSVHMSLRGERVLAQTTHNGRLVEIPPGAPRMLGLVKPPCTPDGCDSQLQLGVYLDKPAQVAVTFGATKAAHRIQTGNQIRELPANRPTTINFKLPAGDQAVNIPVDWTTPDGPAISSVTVETGGATSRIY